MNIPGIRNHSRGASVEKTVMEDIPEQLRTPKVPQVRQETVYKSRNWNCRKRIHGGNRWYSLFLCVVLSKQWLLKMMLNSIVVGFLPDYLSRHRFVQLSHVFCVSLSVTIFKKHWCTCVWVCIPGYYGKLHHDWSRCNIYIRCPIYSCYTFNGHIRKLDRFSDQQKFNTPTKTQPDLVLASIKAA